MSHRLWTIAVSALLPISVHAADIPKEGSANYTNFWVATTGNTIQQGNRSYIIYEIDGVTHNDAGSPMFNTFGQRCVGLVEISEGNVQDDLGTCTYTDRDGDHIFAPYSGGKGDGKGGEHATIKLAGGTGKFSSITGSGEYFNPGLPIKADDKAIRGAVSAKVSWKLP